MHLFRNAQSTRITSADGPDTVVSACYVLAVAAVALLSRTLQSRENGRCLGQFTPAEFTGFWLALGSHLEASRSADEAARCARARARLLRGYLHGARKGERQHDAHCRAFGVHGVLFASTLRLLDPGAAAGLLQDRVAEAVRLIDSKEKQGEEVDAEERIETLFECLAATYGEEMTEGIRGRALRCASKQ